MRSCWAEVASTASGKQCPVTFLAYQWASLRKALNGYEFICIEPTPGQQPE
jgi:hypothetical protein